ncbi:class I SAM-dependent methyltransferase [Gammaproteobacteria bacterium]|nr:class I SAM-dependent methyltransferase [Gammaproteobacteria bacterium]
MNNELYEIYLKSPYKSVKHSTYFKSYEHFLEKYRGTEFTFIEVGVLGGGSLFMWREYFGPKARIIGIDLNPNAKKWEKDGFEIFIGSQADENFWNEVISKVGGIDVCLDDGGHTYEQQIITVESVLCAMNDGGMILVEDTHTSYMDGFGPKKFSFINYVKNKIDHINYRFNFKKRYKKTERRIWSIEIVESMVAFKINKNASNEISEWTENNGEDDSAIDFRYNDYKFVSFVKKIAINFKSLKNIPFVYSVYMFFNNFILSINFKAKKFFK